MSDKKCETCKYYDTYCYRIVGACTTDKWEPKEDKQADPGAKYDSGKTDMSYLEYFPLALEAVCNVSEFGGDKGYIRGSFKDVPDARKRYTAAMLRHYLAEGPIDSVPELDPESGFPHDFAVAWNALCRLELRLRNKE